jgi:hypothetical protein
MISDAERLLNYEEGKKYYVCSEVISTLRLDCDVKESCFM